VKNVPLSPRRGKILSALSVFAFVIFAFNVWREERADSRCCLADIISHTESILAHPGQRRISFIENRGQWNTSAKFRARNGNTTAWFENNAIVLQHQSQNEDQSTKGIAVRLTFEGASPTAALEGDHQIGAVYNYFNGNDRRRWQSGVGGYDHLLYRGLYSGIDLRVQQVGEQLEYDLLLAAGANPDQIIVRCEGAEGFEMTADGSLIMKTVMGPLLQKTPRSWYEYPDGKRQEVECSFLMLDRQRYGFKVPSPNTATPLVIDPGIEWSTFLGGPGDEWINTNGMTIDNSGNILLTGYTTSPRFPTTTGVYHATYGGATDIFIACLNPNTSGADQLVWSTFLGGNNFDIANCIEVNGTGHILVAGYTLSPDFPTTGNAFDREYKGVAGEGFASVLDSTGSLMLYSTLIGGTDGERVLDATIDTAGNILLAGYTYSTDFPTTADAFATTFSGVVDGFIARLDMRRTGKEQLTWSTYLGGSDDDGISCLQADSSGAVVVSGWVKSKDFPTTADAFQVSYQGGTQEGDGFIAKFDPGQSQRAQLRYASYVGGSGNESSNAIAVDRTGIITLAWSTDSPDFPTTAGAYDETHNGNYDVYVSQFDLSRSKDKQLLYSTFIGGTDVDLATSVGIDANGSVVICGSTMSSDFPTTAGAYDRKMKNGKVFVLCLNPSLSSNAQLEYSTFIGGATFDIGRCVALSGDGKVIVAGYTQSPDYPTSSNCYDPTYNGSGDLFLTKIDLHPNTAVSEGNNNLPGTFTLYQNHPNPFNALTSIEFSIAESAHTRLIVYDALGREVRTLADQWQIAGRHSVTFDASGMASGIYTYRLISGSFEQSRKMILLR